MKQSAFETSQNGATRPLFENACGLHAFEVLVDAFTLWGRGLMTVEQLRERAEAVKQIFEADQIRCDMCAESARKSAGLMAATKKAIAHYRADPTTETAEKLAGIFETYSG